MGCPTETRRHSNGSIVAYVVVAAVAYVVARVQIMAVGRIGEGFLRDLRIRVFDHMQSLSLGFFERRRPVCWSLA